MTAHPPPAAIAARRRGFTMIELVMAMLVLGLIIGMVFGTASTSIRLATTVVETQNEVMLEQAFIDLMAGRFASLPGNARFDLVMEDAGSHKLSRLTLQNVPMSFTWGGQERIAKAVQIETVKRRSNYLDIVLRYYETEILEDPEATTPTSTLPAEPFAEIVLLENIRFFEWHVLDGRAMEWYVDWDLQGRLPIQAELVMAFGATGPEIRHVFWIPPRQNPSIVNRQMMQEAQQGGESVVRPGEGQGGGNIPDGGRPQRPPIVIPPTR
jgi:prepilin-type N-terminal cleavage/methylation domain-containing protein